MNLDLEKMILSSKEKMEEMERSKDQGRPELAKKMGRRWSTERIYQSVDCQINEKISDD